MSVYTLVPAPADGSAPVASAYRLRPEEIRHDVCISRRIDDTDSSRDRRWKPMIYREYQCGGTVVSDGLCKTCLRRKAAYTGKPGVWHGLITEEPPSWMHMLGTEWAAAKPPVWTGSVGSSDASSVASATSGEEVKAAQKALRDAEKERKEAEKAAEKAKKEAEKTVKKAMKEIEKATQTAMKEAEKEAARKGRKQDRRNASAQIDAAASCSRCSTPRYV